jgi:hypothetical protein
MLMLALLLLAAPPDVSNAYRIEAPKVVKVKKGAAGQARIEVVPRADAHVSPDAPISLTVSAGPAVTLQKQRLGRAEAKETAAKGVEFDVPFTAVASDEVKGNLTFFICTESLCERQKREVSLQVQVE